MTLQKTNPSRNSASYDYFVSVRNSAIVMFITIITITTITGCKKDSDVGFNFNYDLFYNTRWVTTSQQVSPSWTYPATGKTYTDVWDFSKEMFPCLTDDYVVYYRDGSTHLNYNNTKCDPNDPNEEAPVGYYFLDKPNDSLILAVTLEVPNQKPQILNVRCKILELAKDRLVLRYNQQLPFTNTWHIVTENYKATP